MEYSNPGRSTSALGHERDVMLSRSKRRSGPKGDIFTRQKCSERLHCRTLREVGHRTCWCASIGDGRFEVLRARRRRRESGPSQIEPDHERRREEKIVMLAILHLLVRSGKRVGRQEQEQQALRENQPPD